MKGLCTIVTVEEEDSAKDMCVRTFQKKQPEEVDGSSCYWVGHQ